MKRNEVRKRSKMAMLPEWKTSEYNELSEKNKGMYRRKKKNMRNWSVLVPDATVVVLFKF